MKMTKTMSKCQRKKNDVSTKKLKAKKQTILIMYLALNCLMNGYLQLAIRNEEKLNKLLAGVTIAQGGEVPNI